jgi:hypothetical protein
VFRVPARVGPVQTYTTGTVELWLQPEGFAFTTTRVQPGVAVEANVSVPIVGPLEVFAAVRAKSAGWRPVDPYLDAAFSARVGVNVLLPAHGSAHAL